MKRSEVARGCDSALPDVVLIILDAARGDRFPGWDYPRHTIPNITQIAPEAMSFRNAFAECPTTSCSIPALVTGISFLPGGEVRGGRQLSPEATTLAEYLRPLGYRTVGVSATPNHSAARNLDQGFDEFHEVWGRQNPLYDPFIMSRFASKVLHSLSGAQPLFLQLHYRPPHWPYAPGAEFDRFTDPSYEGPIRPDTPLESLARKTERLADDDLEHLIGLYDGNLLRADAAVGELFAALRETERWASSLIVITSDHGEAFMEHGRPGHNSTLFEEMLHVPLMVRLPHGEIPATADTDRLASLLDVVPTILGRLGGTPAAEVDGLDLLDTSPNPKRPRVLFFQRRRYLMLGTRTPTWKTIVSKQSRAQKLFKVDIDREERTNRLVEHPLIYAGLGLRMQHHLEMTAARGLDGEAVELTPEAEEALRALGYLD